MFVLFVIRPLFIALYIGEYEAHTSSISLNIVPCNTNVTNIVPSVKSSWTCRGQSNGAEVCWGCIWRKHQAYSILMSDTKDAADPAWEGHYCGIHQEWRLQVRMQILLYLYTVCHVPVYTVLCVALLICFSPPPGMYVCLEQCICAWPELL